MTRGGEIIIKMLASGSSFIIQARLNILAAAGHQQSGECSSSLASMNLNICTIIKKHRLLCFCIYFAYIYCIFYLHIFAYFAYFLHIFCIFFAYFLQISCIFCASCVSIMQNMQYAGYAGYAKKMQQ